jgi:translation initiation factor 1A
MGKLFFECSHTALMGKKKTHKGVRRAHVDRNRELIFKSDEGQTYGRVEKMLGNGRLLATSECAQKESNLICKIRGAMRRSEWISVGDTVLIGMREFQDDKADVLHVYNREEVMLLTKWGMLEIPTFQEDTFTTTIIEGEFEIAFEDDDIDGI